MLNSQLLHPPIPPNYNYLPRTYIAFFNNNCCQCLLLLHPGLSKKLQGAGKCAVSVPAYRNNAKSPVGLRFVPVQIRGCTLVHSGPAGANDFMQLRGIVGGCGRVPADKKVRSCLHKLVLQEPPWLTRAPNRGPSASGAQHLRTGRCPP